MRRGILALGLLAVAAAPQAVGGITIVSTSAPTITATAPLVRTENVGPAGCVYTPSANATSGSLAVTSTGGTTDYGACLDLRNTASTARVYKIRHVSGTNENRFNDVQIKGPGGLQHLKWSGGSLTTSETDSWQSLAAGSTTSVSVRQRIGSGPASVITAEILVARSGTTDVTAAYTLTMTFSAT